MSSNTFRMSRYHASKFVYQLHVVKNELHRWESYLGEHDFAAADQFSLAGIPPCDASPRSRTFVDAQLAASVLQLAKLGMSFDNRPNLKAYHDRVQVRSDTQMEDQCYVLQALSFVQEASPSEWKDPDYTMPPVASVF